MAQVANRDISCTSFRAVPSVYAPGHIGLEGRRDHHLLQDMPPSSILPPLASHASFLNIIIIVIIVIIIMLLLFSLYSNLAYGRHSPC